MEKLSKYITVDKSIQNGQPVFKDTRVPVQTLFWHLEKDITIEQFLEDFPSVTRDQVNGVLEIMGEIVGSGQINRLDEVIA